MTDSPVLSITIPTFNRRDYLEQTLNVLFPQLTDEVEVIVLDNCSDDDTSDYMATVRGCVQHIRQKSNIGADRNMISCLAAARGKYIWILCDDDLPCSNAIHNILEGIRLFPEAPMFYLRVIGGDRNLSNYQATPVEMGWTSLEANAFLEEIGAMFTFASSIIVSRRCLNAPFITNQIDSSLVPAAIVLSSVGQYKRAVISKNPLLFARGDNSGGYNAMNVFSRNIVELFKKCDQSWFATNTLKKIYNDNLTLPVLIVVERWPINFSGLITLFRYSYKYSNLYKCILPALAKRIKRHVLKQSWA